jgi:hypothetical protein
MRIPIQSQPIMRKVSTRRINDGTALVYPSCIPLKERLEDCEDWAGRCSVQDGCRGCKLGVSLYCLANPAACCQ